MNWKKKSVLFPICLICILLYTILSYSTSIYSKSWHVHQLTIQDLLKTGLQSTAAAGKLVRKLADNPPSLSTTSKGTTDVGTKDVVTTADIQSNALLERAFRLSHFGVQVVSEESMDLTEAGEAAAEDAAKTHIPHLAAEWPGIDAQVDAVFSSDTPVTLSPEDVVVWIDPLDATKEYAEGKGQYVTVMACITVRGQPLAGVLYFPFERSWVWGFVPSKHATSQARAGGVWATLEAEAAHVDGAHPATPVDPSDSGKTPDPARPRVIVSMSHAGSVRSTLDSVGLSNAQVTSAAGAGYKVQQLLIGQADAYVHSSTIKKWDMCAGDALLRALAAKQHPGTAGEKPSSCSAAIRRWDGSLLSYEPTREAGQAAVRGGIFGTVDSDMCGQVGGRLAGVNA